MTTCPHCGCTCFRVGRAIRVWQTLEITPYEDGGYDVNDDQLHDTLDEEAFTEAQCTNCDTDIPIATLFPQEGSSACISY